MEETKTNKNSQEKDKTYNMLIVEDDFEITDQLERILKNTQRFDCNVTTARSGKEGFEYLRDNDYDVVLSEYEMPDMDGIEFLKKVKEEKLDGMMRFLIIDEGDKDRAKESVKEGIANQYIENPWDSEEVKLTVCEKLKRKEIREKENRLNVSDVSEALNTIEYFQERMTGESEKTVEKETLIFEFDASSEFNKFSFELKRMKNIQILDVHVFENKYVVNVGLYPKSYEKIK